MLIVNFLKVVSHALSSYSRYYVGVTGVLRTKLRLPF